MAEHSADHILPALERLDAKLGRLQATLDDHTVRLQRLEQGTSRVEQQLHRLAEAAARRRVRSWQAGP